jgi:8-amino-7-oxononanoate synthase
MGPRDPFHWLDDEAEARRRDGLVRRVRVRDAREGLIDLASNDYLGLRRDPRVIEAACDAARRHGFGAGASSLVSGWCEAHEALAAGLADFERAEAALLFPTGFAANLGAVAALTGPGDAVFLDRLDHACLVAGARQSGARLRVYPHADAARLDDLLARERARYRRVLIATDGVFSMDGDLAPLPDLLDLATRHDAMLLIDEAHGTGVFGPDGRGAASEMGVADDHPAMVRVGTLSKALGSIGGFVAGSRRLIDHLIHRAPSFIYSTAPPPSAASAALASLQIVRDEPWRRDRVRSLGRSLAVRLRDIGLDVPDVTGPIVPVVLGDPTLTLEAAATLADDAGFLVGAIRPPTVPRGTSRLRVSLTSNLTDEAFERLAHALGPLRPSRPPRAQD